MRVICGECCPEPRLFTVAWCNEEPCVARNRGLHIRTERNTALPALTVTAVFSEGYFFAVSGLLFNVLGFAWRYEATNCSTM